MLRVIDCLTQAHNYWLVAAAALVCAIGSFLAVLSGRRLRRSAGTRRMVQTALTSLVTGATVWATHFIAMLAYDPGLDTGYEPVMTGVSLLIAVFGTALANSLFAYGRNALDTALAGMTFGLSVAAMHYVGMSAYLLPGDILWAPELIAASILLGSGIGAAAFHFIAADQDGPNWYRAMGLMVLAICAMHFTGMGAVEIQLNGAIEVPTKVISDATMAILILAVMAVILLVGFAAFSIETDIEQEARSKLTHAALHDPLTRMPNRIYLNHRLDTVRERLGQDRSARAAILTIDLNLFKEVNDLYGHAAGDEVLKAVAGRLSAALQPGEFIARTGGDEFVAIKEGFRSHEQVSDFAGRLHRLIVDPIDMEEASFHVGASIGIASSLNDGLDPQDLLHKSDLAMYRAKDEPEQHICFYRDEMDRQSRERLMLINDLRHAGRLGQFELAFQLQNDIKSLEPVGFEVLLRWNHPERGRVSPAEFIPIAEETGLIREIGIWVLRTACQEAVLWPRPYSVAVNVAPQQLVQQSFVETVSDILMETGLAPERLELEITEASIIVDQAFTLKVMHRLKEMGIRIAMDDFGTGYSSMAMLQTFPFDKIKIDRSFVQDVHKFEQRAAIVRSTLLLGKALGIPVLAEGVEVADELNFLKAEDCTSVQGFYFGKPMNREEMWRELERAEIEKAS